jgi:hypothetical protein
MTMEAASLALILAQFVTWMVHAELAQCLNTTIFLNNMVTVSNLQFKTAKLMI